MSKKSITLNDFSPKTQEFLKRFGITEETDIGKSFDKWLKENHPNQTFQEIVDERCRQWDEYERQVNEMFNEKD